MQGQWTAKKTKKPSKTAQRSTVEGKRKGDGVVNCGFKGCTRKKTGNKHGTAANPNAVK